MTAVPAAGFRFSSMTNDILFEKRGLAGIITLNKPETLNAVTDAMIRGIDEHLTLWERDAAIDRIIIRAVEGRAFSAGGDIRHLYERGTARDYDFDFFAREYQLNARIAAYPKPYIALVNGIAMGGGVGVSFHGSHRIAGPDITFAMPEVGIGFFPDVGGSFLLSRLPGKLGLYLGLTGSRMKQADCVSSGLATHACNDMEAFEEALCGNDDLEVVVSRFAVDQEPGPHIQNIDLINSAFGGASVEEIVTRLTKMAQEAEEPDDWAVKTLAAINQKSPTSLEIAFRQIQRGAELSMPECMKMEYRILKRVLPGTEFYEGIRATIIDKDGNPDWQPPSIARVDEGVIEQHFADLGDEELPL